MFQTWKVFIYPSPTRLLITFFFNNVNINIAWKVFGKVSSSCVLSPLIHRIEYPFLLIYLIYFFSTQSSMHMLRYSKELHPTSFRGHVLDDINKRGSYANIFSSLLTVPPILIPELSWTLIVVVVLLSTHLILETR